MNPTVEERRSAQGSGLPYITAAFSLASVLAFYGGFTGDLVSIRDGQFEPARMLLCHLAHWNPSHLFWSAATFLVLGALCEREGRGRFLVCLLGAAVAIPITLWRFAPDLPSYGGLSGLDCAFFTLLAGGMLRENWTARNWTCTAASATVLATYAAKILYEVISGGTVFLQDTSGMLPVPLAHVAGGLVGLPIGLLWPRWTGPAASRKPHARFQGSPLWLLRAAGK